MQYGSDVKMSLEKVTQNIIRSYKFDCGNDYINDCFLKSVKNADTTDFVFIDTEANKLIAYYALSCSSIMITSDSDTINLVPAVEISIFSLAKEYQGIIMYEDEEYNLSTYIMDKVVEKIFKFTEEQCGARVIVLYSVPKAYNFYDNYGFSDFVELMKPAASKTLEDCIPMFFNL